MLWCGACGILKALLLWGLCAGQSVQTFTGRKINNTCVELAWDLLPGGPAPMGFVIEWPDPSRELEWTEQAVGMVQWIRVPPADRAVYVHGMSQCMHMCDTETEHRMCCMFFSTSHGALCALTGPFYADQHTFTLHTLYEDGEGKSIQCICKSFMLQVLKCNANNNLSCQENTDYLNNSMINAL